MLIAGAPLSVGFAQRSATLERLFAVNELESTSELPSSESVSRIGGEAKNLINALLLPLTRTLDEALLKHNGGSVRGVTTVRRAENVVELHKYFNEMYM